MSIFSSEISYDQVINFVQTSTGLTVTGDGEELRLNSTQVAAISYSANTCYYGKLIFSGTSDLVSLYMRLSGADVVSFTNAEVIASGVIAGSFNHVMFNKIATISAGAGEFWFVGYKITLS